MQLLIRYRAFLAVTIIGLLWCWHQRFLGYAIGPLLDDVVFVSITRRWCAGARLYADFWDNKGPFFFSWLSMGCLLPSTDPYSVRWEIGLFYLPLVLLYASALQIISNRLRLSLLSAILFAVILIYFGMGRDREFILDIFMTERLVIALVFLASALIFRRRTTTSASAILPSALYALIGLSTWRAIFFSILGVFNTGFRLRSVLVSAFLMALTGLSLLAVVLGFDADSWRYFINTLPLPGLGYVLQPNPSLPVRNITDLFSEGILGSASNYLIDPVAYILSLNSTPITAMLTGYIFIALVFVGISFKRNRDFWQDFFLLLQLLIAPLLSSLASGYVWNRNYIFYLPFIAFGLLQLLNKYGRIVQSLLAIWVVLILYCAAQRPQSPCCTVSKAASSRNRTADIISKTVVNKPWVSLLQNIPSPMLNPNFNAPINRVFHNYCYLEYRWNTEQIREIIHKQQVIVVVSTRFKESECTQSKLISEIAESCQILPQSNREVEFYDCPEPTQVVS